MTWPEFFAWPRGNRGGNFRNLSRFPLEIKQSYTLPPVELCQNTLSERFIFVICDKLISLRLINGTNELLHSSSEFENQWYIFYGFIA